MAKMRIKLSYEGIGQMLRGEEMKALMEQYGAQTASRAGDGYEIDVHNTGQRQAVWVRAVSSKAIKDCLQNNTLLKSL